MSTAGELRLEDAGFEVVPRNVHAKNPSRQLQHYGETNEMRAKKSV
jgi:hypothetical protein